MMKNLIVSAAVSLKLEGKHEVTVREVEQCFENRIGVFLEDTREDHQTDPPTLWFIALTNRQRPLKIVFIFSDGNIHLKTAYPPEAEAIAIYDEHGR